jgi:hypothetical protein
MKQPLIMRRGLFQAAEEEPVQILSLNFGDAEPIVVNSQTIVKSRTRHTLVRGTSRRVRTIQGGEEGDLLLLQGNVILVSGGNIATRIVLRTDRVTQLLFTGGFWTPFL